MDSHHADLEHEYIYLDNLRGREGEAKVKNKKVYMKESKGNAITAVARYAVLVTLGSAFLGGVANLVFILINH